MGAAGLGVEGRLRCGLAPPSALRAATSPWLRHREDWGGFMRQTSRTTVKKARALRRVMSPPEVLLWQQLRLRPGGVKFRRQHPVGRFVADFYAPEGRVIVEVDGLAHDARVEHDADRDAWLTGQGFVMVRVGASDVLRDVDRSEEHTSELQSLIRNSY